MLGTGQQFQDPQQLLAMHRHHPDYMSQTVDHQKIAYRINTPQITLYMSSSISYQQKRYSINHQHICYCKHLQIPAFLPHAMTPIPKLYINHWASNYDISDS